jgi:hypothetical protein
MRIENIIKIIHWQSLVNQWAHLKRKTADIKLLVRYMKISVRSNILTRQAQRTANKKE